MSLTRRINVNGSLTSANGINVSLHYEYGAMESVGNINFNFSYNDASFGLASVNGSFNVSTKKVTSYNVSGGAIISQNVFTDVIDSVLDKVAADPKNITDITNGTTVTDSSAD